YQYDYDENELNLISTFHHSPSVEYRHVDVSGTHAFISCRYGLEVVDVTDISNPLHDIYIRCGKFNKDLVAKDYRVFMSGAFYGVYIFNFEDHFATGGVVKYDLFDYDPEHGPVNCVDVDVNGDFLYVADYYNGFQIFDWRESEWLGECYSAIRCNPSGVAVSGDWAYMTTTSDYTGILYVIDVHEPDSVMLPYATYYNEHGAVSPDPCSHLMSFVSGRPTPHAAFTMERIAYSPSDVAVEWTGHTEINPSSDWMFNGWIVTEGNYAYVCGRGYTLTKYDISDAAVGPAELCTTTEIDEGYSAVIYGDYIYVAGKHGLWKLNKDDLSFEDLDETVQIYGEVALYGNYAFVMGLDTPNALTDSIRRVIAAYDISGDSIVFKDTMFLDVASDPRDIAYQDNWYYFGLINALKRVPGSDIIYIHASISTRAREWWTPSSNVFIPHSGGGIHTSNFNTSVEEFAGRGYGHAGMWGSGKAAFGWEFLKADFNWNTSEGCDFASIPMGLGWPGANWYSYGVYPTTDSDSIRTHYMFTDYPNYYWAVWDEGGSSNSERFPLWFCQDWLWGEAIDFTRINNPTPIDPLWGDFEEYIPIHFAMNGSDELVLITKKAGELHYYIDVLQVTHHLCSGGLSKGRTENKVSQPDKLSINVNPNPFNASCNIEFNLPEETQVNIEVYNTCGSKVYESCLGELGSGQYKHVWNGIDETGVSVSSGLYLVRVKTTNSTLTQKVLLLK
ncbi:T9SS type A sorting domain-containing protein, partial [bacterium]|nr:T9SS type A sorting domain-containing protein [bacterium]